MPQYHPMATPTLSLGRLLYSLVSILIFPALVLFLSGDWWWVEGWIFSVWFIALSVGTVTYLYLRDPALLAERYQTPGSANQKGWDRYVVYGIGIGFFGWIIVMPLDAKKYGWSPHFPLWLKGLGGLTLLASSFLFFRAHTDNTFLSPLVRIQSERKQRVVSTGVYGFVRHPMYLGAVLLFIGAPLLMGSLFGIGAGVAMSLLLAGRIVGEEKMLTGELEGYADYKERVRSRLIPYVW